LKQSKKTERSREVGCIYLVDEYPEMKQSKKTERPQLLGYHLQIYIDMHLEAIKKD